MLGSTTCLTNNLAAHNTLAELCCPLLATPVPFVQAVTASCPARSSMTLA